jgi:hypothetical protein
MSIDQSVFPDKLKKAQVTPLYKKNDPLLKTNYRPLSVLCIFSKIFEKIVEQQSRQSNALERTVRTATTY